MKIHIFCIGYVDLVILATMKHVRDTIEHFLQWISHCEIRQLSFKVWILIL